MNYTYSHRKATLADLQEIIKLYHEDELGQTREKISENISPKYIKAFELINTDPNQYLMVIESNNKIIGTCHLTIMPSLTFEGSTRLQIEAVRVLEGFRSKKVGEWMINTAIQYGNEHNAKIIQLTTNKKRDSAIRFYEKLGFQSTHEGMKLYIK